MSEQSRHCFGLHSRRQLLVSVTISGIWGLLALRLLYVQCISQELFASQAARQQISLEEIPARHGDILDRQGRVLATTVAVPSLYVDPSRIKDVDLLARQLATAVGLDAEQLTARLRRTADKRFLWVKRQLTSEQQQRVQELQLPSEVVGFRTEFKRYYPQEGLAAHVIGLRNIDGEGRGGAEQAFDQILKGTAGVRRFVRDARGVILEVLEEVTQPPVHGESITLSIDTLLQLRTEAVLDQLMNEQQPVGACAIVLDPHTGEVLAMASRPGFHPGSLEDVPDNAWKNLAISAMYEPGSTMKPLVVAWGLDHQLLQTHETFHCEYGTYRMGRRVLHDHHRYGELSLTDVLVKSSNIGMAKIGERLGNEELFKLATSFGFGQRTGIELSGEVSGMLHPLANWTTYSTGSIPMGHELAVTPLQMIAAHAVLANGGRKISPHLLLGTASSQPRQVVVSQILDAAAADWVVQHPMAEVVSRGTGTKAKLRDYSVFGKTGTAQKPKPGGGYYANKNFASFIGGAPAEAPRLLVLVCIDEPRGASQFGGTIAAPYAAQILDRCLKTLER